MFLEMQISRFLCNDIISPDRCQMQILIFCKKILFFLPFFNTVCTSSLYFRDNLCKNFLFNTLKMFFRKNKLQKSNIKNILKIVMMQEISSSRTLSLK